MEKLGNIGWFITNEEKSELEAIITRLEYILNVGSEKKGEPTITEPNTIPYDPHPFGINEPPCPKCPWKNPADWTWRPEQAPWYGEPIFKDYKVGDGEWWKNSPYCTTTTGYEPNAVKESKTTGEEEKEIKIHKTLDEDWCR